VLTAAVTAAVVVLLPAAPVAADTFKWSPTAPLARVKDATGLAGDRLVPAPRVQLPGADAGGVARLVVRSSGVDRTYLLAPARRVAPRARPALLIVLPALNNTLRSEYDRYHLDALRDHGITVMVAGTYDNRWNAGYCCSRPVARGIDDVAAVVAMRADAVRRTGADAVRTALLGHSAGALMAWRLACTPWFGATAVAAISGTLVSDCPSLSRTPHLLSLNGERDTTVPVDGATRVVSLLGIAPPSVRASFRRLAVAGRCGPATTSAGGGVAVTSHTGCTGGGSVRLEVVQGEGHVWFDLDATRRAARFLAGAVTGVR